VPNYTYADPQLLFANNIAACKRAYLMMMVYFWGFSDWNGHENISRRVQFHAFLKGYDYVFFVAPIFKATSSF